MSDTKTPEELGLSPDPAAHKPGSPEAIYVEAYSKGEAAMIAEPAYCGFAWVKIKPARGPFVSFLKRHGMGDNGVYGGWEISVGSYRGQSMDLKEAGCRGFAEALRTHGIKAFLVSRAD